jgi:hypothetical protein
VNIALSSQVLFALTTGHFKILNRIAAQPIQRGTLKYFDSRVKDKAAAFIEAQISSVQALLEHVIRRER